MNKIINTDCIEGLKQLEENSVDLCVTSPPYNVGIEYDGWDDNMQVADYFQFAKDWLVEVYRILKPDGRIAVNIPYEVNMKKLGGHNRVLIQSEYHQLMKEIGYGFAGIVDLDEKAPQILRRSSRCGHRRHVSHMDRREPDDAILSHAHRASGSCARRPHVPPGGGQGEWSYRAGILGAGTGRAATSLPCRRPRGRDEHFSRGVRRHAA